MTEAIVHHRPPAQQLEFAQLEIDGFFKRDHRDGPNLPDLAEYFHRGPDGLVAIQRKVKNHVHDVCSLPIAVLRDLGPQRWLPGLLKDIRRDSYAGINSMFRHGYRTRQRTRKVLVTPPLNDPNYGNVVLDYPHLNVRVPVKETYTVREGRQPSGLLYAHRDSESVRWINAAWVDCDGRLASPAQDAPATIAGIIRAYRLGKIPVPSLILSSGRGAWGVWLLIDERNPAEGTTLFHGAWHTADTPCRASRRSEAIHQAINQELAARLADNGADPKSGDLARVCRIPGSINSEAPDADRVVEVLHGFGGHTQPPRYTLSQLADWLGLDTPVVIAHQRTNRPLSAAQIAQRINAQQARDLKIHNALKALSDLRHGIREGHRNFWLHWFVQAGQLGGLDAATLTAAAWRFGKACRPPLTDKAIRSGLNSGRKRARAILAPRPPEAKNVERVGYKRLIRDLQITAAEQDAISLRANGPYQKKAITKPSKKRAALDAAISRLVAQLPAIPSTTDMAGHLQALGLQASPMTVSRAYGRIGISSTLTGGRPTAPALF